MTVTKATEKVPPDVNICSFQNAGTSRGRTAPVWFRFYAKLPKPNGQFKQNFGHSATGSSATFADFYPKILDSE